MRAESEDTFSIQESRRPNRQILPSSTLFFCLFFLLFSPSFLPVSHVLKPFNFYVRYLKLNNITATRGGEAGSRDFVFFFFFFFPARLQASRTQTEGQAATYCTINYIIHEI